MINFKGKKILITGSTGGIGKGLGNLRLEHVFDLRGREYILDHLILDKNCSRCRLDRMEF